MTKQKVGVLILVEEPEEGLAETVQRLGDYDSVEVAQWDRDPGAAVEAALSIGVECLLIIPSLALAGQRRIRDALSQIVSELQKSHPNIKLLEAWPTVEVDYHAQFLVQNLELRLLQDANGDSVPLAILTHRERGTVQKLNGGNQLVSRLAALGFIPGAPVVMEQNYGFGPLIVTVRETRLALGRAEAAKILVRPHNGGHGRRRDWTRRGWKRHHGRKRNHG